MLPSTKMDVLQVLVIKGKVHKSSTSTIVDASQDHSKSSNFHFAFIHDYILLHVASSSMNLFMPLEPSMSRVEMTETTMFPSTGPTSKEVWNITSRNTPMLQPLVFHTIHIASCITIIRLLPLTRGNQLSFQG